MTNEIEDPTLASLAKRVDEMEPWLRKRDWAPMTYMGIPSLLANTGRLLAELRAYRGPAPLVAGALHERLYVLRRDFIRSRRLPPVPEREPAQGRIEEQLDDIGPQRRGDGPFLRQMRLQQSLYRRDVLRVPYGTGPEAKSTTPYGNMLRPEDARCGLNFLTSEIFEVVRERLVADAAGVERFRLLHNMLSSQPMCFNLFGPLVRDLELAARLVQPLVGPVDEVTDVRIEVAPAPASAYLDDATAFDAFIAYRRPDGARGFVSIETKLAEPFSRTDHDGPVYRRWMKAEGPWLPAAREAPIARAFNQLWRDHLLAIALRDHPGSPYEEGHLALVRHPGDRACVRALEGYRGLLRSDDGTLLDWPLDRLLAAWAPLAGRARRAWLRGFEERYLHPRAPSGSAVDGAPAAQGRRSGSPSP